MAGLTQINKSPHITFHEHHYTSMPWDKLPPVTWCVLLYTTGVAIHGVGALEFLSAQQVQQGQKGAAPDNRSYLRCIASYLVAHPVQSAVAGTATVFFGAMTMRALNLNWPNIGATPAAAPAAQPTGK